MEENKELKRRFKEREAVREQIKKDLEKQLSLKKNSSHYTQLINDYVFMWDTMQELKLDIKERGVSVFWQNSENQYGYKKNDSIREMTTVNNQMLKILKELGLDHNSLIEEDPDEHYL